jgi:hypothetical protein
MNKFDIIYDKSELKNVIDFLGDGFGLSLEKRIAFIKLLERNPADYPIAAVTTKNGKMTAAMLLIAQISCSINNDLKVLNLSTWYALPKNRGVEAIIFIKKLLNQLNGYVFTNYTPNDTVTLILKSFGFTNMNVFKYICGFSRNKIFRFELNSAKFFFANTGLILFTNLESLHTNYVSNNSIKPLYWIYSSKKYFLNIRVLNIYINNPSEYKYPSMFSIFYIMLRFRVVSLNIILSLDDYKNQSNSMPWLFKSSDLNCRHFSPIGSELTALSEIK